VLADCCRFVFTVSAKNSWYVLDPPREKSPACLRPCLAVTVHRWRSGTTMAASWTCAQRIADLTPSPGAICPLIQLIFTAGCYASPVLAMALCPSVRLSVRPSVTSRSSTKTAKCRITQTTPHDSPGTPVFWCQRSPRNSTGVTPYGGTKCRWCGSKSATLHKLPAISRKRYKIDAWFPLKSNRKSYALYRMVTLPMTLSAP